MKFKLIMLSALILTIGIQSCTSEHHHHKETPTLTVTNPVLRDTTIYRKYVSQIRSINHIELRSQERGYLEHIYVDEGQFVKKGQLMFKIMPIVYQAEMQMSKAEAEFAKIEYQNTKQLADSNIVSNNELALAKAQYDKAKAELQLSQAHLNFTEIRAPFDGIVGRFHEVRLGSLIDEGELLTKLSDNRKMWVYFNVPEAEYLDYAMRKKSDSLLKVKLELANGKIFSQQGIVETIEADFNNETGNIAFRATFANPDQILRHGETGSILIPTELENAMIIPQESTFEILDKKYVYVVDKEGKLETRKVTISEEMEHFYVISDGLKTNDHILIEGLRKVKNGDKIKFKKVSFDRVKSDLVHLRAE